MGRRGKSDSSIQSRLPLSYRRQSGPLWNRVMEKLNIKEVLTLRMGCKSLMAFIITSQQVKIKSLVTSAFWISSVKYFVPFSPSENAEEQKQRSPENSAVHLNGLQ